jgi:hypothetical protein
VKTRIAIPLMFLLVAGAAFAQTSQKQFETIKSLAGSWEGKTSQGQPVSVSYRVTSGGSAVMSEIQGQEDMITMFHMDGDRLLMTHYCGAGNQPRMKASASADGKSISFEMIDATNLASPSAGHMHKAVFTVVDANHHTEDWYFIQDGKEMHERFEVTRKKAS